MNFKQFFLERSGHRHMSTAALTTGGLHKTKGSFSLVAKDITKKQMLGVNNPKLKRAKEAPKGTKVPLSSTTPNLNKLKSAGSQIKFDKIRAGQSKTLAAGKNGERVKVHRDPVTKKLILKK